MTCKDEGKTLEEFKKCSKHRRYDYVSDTLYPQI